MQQPAHCRAVAAQLSSFPVLPPVAINEPVSLRWRRRRSVVLLAVAAILLIGRVAHPDTLVVKPRDVTATAGAFATFIAEASQRFEIPAAWIRAVMQAESAGDAHALSPKGAMGLMQIMPETWAALRSRYALGADPYDAHDNILAGAAYLRELHDRYGEPGFLAAYNAGPARYEDHVATGRPLPAATHAYLAVVTQLIGDRSFDGTVTAEAIAPGWTDAPLFVVHAESSAMPSAESSPSHVDHRPAVKTAEDWTALVPQSQGLFVTTARGIRRP